MRTGGNGVETGRTRELRGLRRKGSRGGGGRAILTKQRARQTLRRVSRDKRRPLQHITNCEEKWRNSLGALRGWKETRAESFIANLTINRLYSDTLTEDTFSRSLSLFLPPSSLRSYNFLIVNIQGLFYITSNGDNRMIIGDYRQQLYR